MKRLSLLLSLVLLAAPGLLQADGPPTTIPIDTTGFTTLNACVPELVVSTGGTLLFQIHPFTDTNGGFHFQVKNTCQNVTATGAVTGDSYRITCSFQEKFNAIPGAAFERTILTRFRMISAGSNDNALGAGLDGHFKITVDANGVPRVAFVKATSTCRG